MLLVALSSCVSSAPQFDNNTYSIICNTRSYWAFVPIDRTLVSSWLPSGVTLSSHPFNLSSDVFPVYLEFNQQADCYALAFPGIKQTMLEFKVEVPYLQQNGLKGPLMFKPLVYEDNEIEVIGTRAQYGLNCIKAQEMQMNNETGEFAVIGENNLGLVTSFKPTTDQWTPIVQADFAQTFLTLNDATEWLGHNLLQEEKCAKDYYVWNQTTVRPILGTIHIDAGFLINDKQPYDYTITGDLPAVQIDTILRITSLEDCTKA